MKNSKQLTEVLANTIERLRDETISIDAAKQINHAAGRLIKTQAVQIAYNKAIGKPGKKIEFMEC